ncbi:MAG: STM4013/SEN3800 family hydrolase [Thermoanaerobaculia bacterium]|nr:STM4013/SEN3800 family hydrolase [Thermoanaerobaculia bacterium]
MLPENAPVSTQPGVTSLVGTAHFLMVTLDTLRYDVAQTVWRKGGVPTLQRYLGPCGWERRHTPGSFTFAAHQAFLSGFLPTPTSPGPHPRLFASTFEGSQTAVSSTFVFEEATLPEAFSARGYRTLCIGGTGFFNRRTALGRVLPDLFEEALWEERFGVTCKESPFHQVEAALQYLSSSSEPVFMLLNIAAIHQPNWFYGASRGPDTLETHAAALRQTDKALEPLFDYLGRGAAPAYCIVCSDHGTAYGEDGYWGHRLAHPVVWDVPYVEFVL